MKIELLIARAGPGGGSRGEVVEVADEAGKRLVELGEARPVASKSKREKAVSRKPQTPEG